MVSKLRILVPFYSDSIYSPRRLPRLRTSCIQQEEKMRNVRSNIDDV